MDHICSEGNNQFPTPEQDIEIFKMAMADGDTKHAIFHLACALSTNPHNSEWMMFLDELIETNEDLLSFVPVEDNNYFALMAVRAYICAKTYKFNEAFNLLGQVIHIKPEIPYLIWLPVWISKIQNIYEIQPNMLISFMGGAIKSTDLLPETVKQKVLTALISLLTKMCSANPKEYLLFWCLSSVQRRQKEYDAALLTAKNAYKINKCWNTAIGLALCYKAQGNIRKAASFYKKASRTDRGDETCYLDLGDMYLDYKLYKKALKAYKKAAAINPDNYWATPSILYCEYLVKRSTESIKKLKEYHIKNPTNMRARDLLYTLRSSVGTPFVDYIPEPWEASINTLRQLTASKPNLESGGSVKFTINNIEAPSAINSFELYLNNFGRLSNAPKLNLIVQNVPTPDPRKPLDPQGLILWNYEGCNATPTVPRPLKKAIDAVYELAISPYQLEEWYKKAGEIAKRLSPAVTPDLLSIMVHPPQPPQNFTSWRWIQHIQYSSVFILANLDSTKPSKSLVSICFGQLDWPMDAAITALVHQALLFPDNQEKVSSILAKVMERIPDAGYCFFTYSLVTNWLKLQCIDNKLRKELELWKSELEKN